MKRFLFASFIMLFFIVTVRSESLDKGEDLQKWFWPAIFGTCISYLLFRALTNDSPLEQTRFEAREELYHLAGKEQLEILKGLKTENQIKLYVEEFWIGKDENYREKHLRRVAYVKEFLHEYPSGVFSDRGRVYILFGPPDDIIFTETPLNFRRNQTPIFSVEIWTYDQPSAAINIPVFFNGINSNGRFFVFGDYGDGYQKQVYSTELNERIDPRIHSLP